MRKLTATVLMFFMLATAGMVQAQSIGHVNFQEVLASLPQAQTVQTQINTLTTDLQAQYQTYLTEFQTKYAEFQQQGPTWSATKQEAATTDLQGLEQRIQEFEISSQQKIQQKQEELMQPLITSVSDAIKAVGAEKGLTYIMDSANMYYSGGDAVDVTTMVKSKLGI